MTIWRVALLCLAVACSSCGKKEKVVAPAPAKGEKGVSIENQAPEPPPPAAAPQADPSTPSPTPDPAGDPAVDDAANQKSYARHIEWLRMLKMGDEKQKKDTLKAIKKANLSAKERAAMEELKAHYNIQVPIEY
jgi:hypothetical protein